MAQDNSQAPIQLNKPSEIERRMLLKRISEMDNLPTPSENVMKAMLLLRRSDAQVDQLAAAIEKDQSLAAQILKMVNSSFYELRSTVSSVERAVALLGISNIKRIVYSAVIMEFFSPDEQVEWNHAYSSSVLMAALVKEGGISSAESLPLSMLLHDIGKVVLRRCCPQKCKLISSHAAKDNLPVYDCEMSSLGLSHAEAGAILLERWGVSGEIVAPVFQHHMEGIPQECVFETALVQFVNWVDCSARGIPCRRPSQELMDAAGVEGVDDAYWLDYQAKLIDGLEHGGASIRELDDAAGKLLPKDGMQKTQKIEKSISRQGSRCSAREQDILERGYKRDA